MVFSFLPKKCALYLKNEILCLFLKNVSPSKRVIYFTLNNLHFPMVEGIVFYAQYKSRMLIIPCKADDFCLLIGLPDEILKKSPGIVFQFMVFSFLPKHVHFISKNSISCLFFKNVSPSKRVICFIRKNLHFPMVEGIAFYALHKSRVLIIPCKANCFCLFIGLPDKI